MILAVVKAAALQFFGAVLPVIMAGLGMAVILVVFPPLTFQPILIVLSSRMIAIPVVPLAVLAIPVVPMLAVATGLFPLRAALLADHAFLFLAHFPLLVAILGAVHPFAPLKLALLPHLFPVVVPVGHKRVLRSGGVGRDRNVRRVRQKMTGSGCIGVAQGQAGQQRSGTKACNVFHGFFPQTSHQCCEKGRSSGLCATRNRKALLPRQGGMRVFYPPLSRRCKRTGSFCEYK